jgi:drug/metabolite transporter (DMT)-like permease
MAAFQVAPMGRTSWLMLLALSVLWGSSFLFYKLLDADLPPLTIVLGRVGFAALILTAIGLAGGERMGRSLPWRGFLILGFFNSAVPFSLFAWGEMHIPSGLASIMNAMTPVFAVVLAHWARPRERLTWARGAGVLCGLLGVVVLVGPDALQGIGSATFAADAGCLLAALSYAVGGLYARRLRGVSPMQMATGQLIGATLIMLPVAAVFDRFWELPLPGAATCGAMAGIVLLCTVLAYILYFRILAVSGATNVMLVTFLLPVNALLLGFLVLGEQVRWASLVGVALIGAGLAAIDGRVLQWGRAAAEV